AAKRSASSFSRCCSRRTGTAKRPPRFWASATRPSSTRSKKTASTRRHSVMTSSAFYEEGSKLLTPGAFEFVLDAELKRAVRSQIYLTLVVVEARREWEGITVTADDGTLQEVASLIGREIRDTDLIGHTDRGTLGLVLLDADVELSTRVIDRLVSRIENYEFPTALRI